MEFHAGAKKILAAAHCRGAALFRDIDRTDAGIGCRTVYLYAVLSGNRPSLPVEEGESLFYSII